MNLPTAVMHLISYEAVEDGLLPLRGRLPQEDSQQNSETILLLAAKAQILIQNGMIPENIM